MNDTHMLEKRLAVIAWGTLFLLLGALMIVPGDQGNLFIFLSGFVLLGLNLARSLKEIPVSPFSITLGFLAVGLGGLGLAWHLFNLPRYEISFVPLAMLCIGLYLLVPGSKKRAEGS